MKTYVKGLLVPICSLAVSTATWGAVCIPGTLADYTATGFACTIGDLEFSEFIASANFYGANSVSTSNLPSAIIVTPQVLSDAKGFAFSNMNVSFSGGLSNTTSNVLFEVDAVGAAITDASLQLGTHSVTGPQGLASAGFSDFFGTVFSLSATHDSSVDIHSASSTFTGVAGFRASTGVSAIVTGFSGGSALVDGYTVLLSTSVAVIPEPETYAMLIAGLGLLGFAARRRKKMGTYPISA